MQVPVEDKRVFFVAGLYCCYKALVASHSCTAGNTIQQGCGAVAAAWAGVMRSLL